MKRYGRFLSAASLALALSSVLLFGPGLAQAVHQCGGQKDTCKCGRNNFCICNGTCGNCVWHAWHEACCNWKRGLEWCTHAKYFNDQARSRGYPTGGSPHNGSIFVCEAGGSCSKYGHVGWVKKAYADGSFDSTEQFWGGPCGTHRRHRSRGFANGGFIYNPSGSKPPPTKPPPSNCRYVKTYRLGGVNLNIRPDASTSRSPVGSVPEGKCLKVLSRTKSGQSISGDRTWYKIKYGGRTGWISGYYAKCSSCGGPAPECSNGQTRKCYTGPKSSRGKGTCRDGKQKCSGGKWGSCSGQVLPRKEICKNGKDDDCDGKKDEGCPDCKDGESRACYTGPKGTRGKGVCRDGKQKCSGGKWGGCAGQSLPVKELCHNKKDDDCDGKTDEGCAPPPKCKDGQKGSCYSGPPETRGKGICRAGTRECSGGKWGSCKGQVTPKKGEVCHNRKDDDCDGDVDEGCPPKPECKEGEERACYTGPKATRGKGGCRDGTRSCVKGLWGADCKGEVKPSEEACGNARDDDCDGEVDEGCTAPPGCEDRDKDGFKAGRDCSGDEQLDCNDKDDKINPKAKDICGNGVDEDCKGGDLVCMRLGEAGCVDGRDCEGGVCARLNGVSRCSVSCKEKKCPAGYRCVDGIVCWPAAGVKSNNPVTRLCNSATDCRSGESCLKGVCSNPPAEGCGCDVSAGSEGVGIRSGLLWILLYLLGLSVLRMRGR